MVRYILRPSYAQTETLRAALDAIRSTPATSQSARLVLIITDYANQVRDMMSLARALDVPGNNDGIYTIPVKHADAQQLAQKLNEILGIAGGGGGGAVHGGGRARRRRGQGRRPRRRRRCRSSVPSKILVDDRTNTLIVVSSDAGYHAGQGARRSPRHLARHRRRHVDSRASARERARRGARTTLNNALSGRGQQSRGSGQPGAPAAGRAASVGDLGTRSRVRSASSATSRRTR